MNGKKKKKGEISTKCHYIKTSNYSPVCFVEAKYKMEKWLMQYQPFVRFLLSDSENSFSKYKNRGFIIVKKKILFEIENFLPKK